MTMAYFIKGIKLHLRDKAYATFRCASCNFLFRPGDTMTFGADGTFAFKWLHKTCYEESHERNS